ncbi:ATP synthase F1 subcomplex epsilon subunit [Tranquillimonas rosea]|uniref:ATP synthase epsilon chain n=1 Tax=Tranquillimonas rosea TaxID=641238 RepID=A0A1H9RIE7_9RHOB|nr:F0F1 ATP synthase subunit epsilon [Tranquillimonas rosea]SER72502.1 ATP synthase F1 subcomplex epsilon subunit [Tranquillimonas rosea]
MADTFQFDLVSPERLLVSKEITEVVIPGAEGDLTAMAQHAPMLTTLRPGIVRLSGSDGSDEYAVTGGFAEIGPSGVSLLAERSMHVSEVTQDILEDFMTEAEENYRKAREAEEHGAADDIAKLLADMVAMGSHIGLSPRQPNL